MKRRAQLIRLTALAELQRDGELAKLQALSQRQRQLEAARAELRAQRHLAQLYAMDCPETAIAGLRFEALALARQTALETQIATLAPDLDAARAGAARAVGRHSVLQKLVQKS